MHERLKNKASKPARNNLCADKLDQLAEDTIAFDDRLNLKVGKQFSISKITVWSDTELIYGIRFSYTASDNYLVVDGQQNLRLSGSKLMTVLSQNIVINHRLNFIEKI